MKSGFLSSRGEQQSRNQGRLGHQQQIFPISLLDRRLSISDYYMIHTYNYGLKHYMFVLNLACLFFKTSGSLSSAVMLSSCCIKHRTGGIESVVLKANTTKVDIFTRFTQMHTKQTEFGCENQPKAPLLPNIASPTFSLFQEDKDLKNCCNLP